jgi:hypothetical protein
MTNDIGSDSAPQPQEVEMAILKERAREARIRDKAILEAMKDIKEEQDKQGIMLALGNQRFDAIEATQEDTTDRLVAIEADKRGVAGIVAGVVAGLAALGSYFK